MATGPVFAEIPVVSRRRLMLAIRMRDRLRVHIRVCKRVAAFSAHSVPCASRRVPATFGTPRGCGTPLRRLSVSKRLLGAFLRLCLFRPPPRDRASERGVLYLHICHPICTLTRVDSSNCLLFNHPYLRLSFFGLELRFCTHFSGPETSGSRFRGRGAVPSCNVRNLDEK